MSGRLLRGGLATTSSPSGEELIRRLLTFKLIRRNDWVLPTYALIGFGQTHEEHGVLEVRLLLGDHGAADGHDRGDDAVDPLG
jgi:hypothetical protein